MCMGGTCPKRRARLCVCVCVCVCLCLLTWPPGSYGPPHPGKSCGPRAAFHTPSSFSFSSSPPATHTHTHTHAGRPEVAVNLFSAFSHPGPSFLKDPPGAV